MSGDIEMHKDQVTAIAGNVMDLSSAVGNMASYNAGYGINAGHFGTCPGAPDAGAELLQTMSALQNSVKAAATFIQNAGNAINASVAATTATDEDSQWGITNAGKGA